MNKQRILLIDDEAGFTRLLKLNLEHTGRYVVQAVNDPVGALARAEEFRPDLILLDVMMPVLDGGDLAAQFQAHERLRQIPLVFLTAAVKKQELQAGQGRIGGLPFLAKPISFEEVQSCIADRLGA